VDGSGEPPFPGDVAIDGGRILEIGEGLPYVGDQTVDGKGSVLAPGFIDVHTHDDLYAIRDPQMLAKLSQGVTTVVVGNCGISAAPVPKRGRYPDPMNLLGAPEEFRYPSFSAYVAALASAHPAVNVAALIGHTSLRNNHMDRLDREATPMEVAKMREQLRECLEEGALGLSTGLAYLSAFSATTEEVCSLAEPLADFGALYTTHMRSETEPILEAMREAFEVGTRAQIPVVVSHLKCAGIANWGRSGEVLNLLEQSRAGHPIGCDCYPYAAGSSTLDLRQVDERVKIQITWSEPHPEVAGHTLSEIASTWQVTQHLAAERLRPAGAIYHSIDEGDMRRILSHEATMIGSDGLPSDPRPHPRLWGTFPRVLGRYVRELGLLTLADAVRKMTGLSATRFALNDRGFVRAGHIADLVMFDQAIVEDVATFETPQAVSKGVLAVWVNGSLSFDNGQPTATRAGRFVRRGIRASWA
jgi:N-acyl-D-amino-acid deacylase